MSELLVRNLFERINSAVGKAVANHAEVQGSIISRDVESCKKRVMKYFLPWLMLLYRGNLDVKFTFLPFSFLVIKLFSY